MKNVLGVVNLVNEWDELEELTYNRCIASTPFGGRYRLIDFVMSSMVNSGITKVAVFTHTKYRSLMDHLGSGKEWDLDRKRNGLFILPPVTDTTQEILRGDLYHYYAHRDYFNRSDQEYVFISRSHMVCNVDLNEALQFHFEHGGDITMLYKRMDEVHGGKCRRIELQADGRVTGMQDHTGRSRSNCISMEMFVMSKELLLDLVETSLARGQDYLFRDAMMKNMDRLNIYGHEYKGYLGVVNTVPSYYSNSMELLKYDVWNDLFFNPGLIYTKIKDEPPARYRNESKVSHSLIANGCVIEGTVENSILFRGARVEKGAVVKNSIVMQGSRIHERSVIKNAILDKDVIVGKNKTLQGDPVVPFIAGKRKII